MSRLYDILFDPIWLMNSSLEIFIKALLIIILLEYLSKNKSKEINHG